VSNGNDKASRSPEFAQPPHFRVAGQIESAVLNRISVPLDGGTSQVQWNHSHSQ
jgi:hypothetical protein